MAKFKEGTPELEMLNDMVMRDMGYLQKKLYPEKLGDKINIIDKLSIMTLLIEHSGRLVLYNELGADVAEYEKLIRKEMDNVKNKKR